MNEHKVTPTQVRKPVARHKRSPKHDLTLTAEEIIGMERAAYDRGWKGGSPLLRLLRQQPKKGGGNMQPGG